MRERVDKISNCIKPTLNGNIRKFVGGNKQIKYV